MNWNMFIRLFAIAVNESEAKTVAENVLSSIRSYIESVDYVKCVPYWKIDGLYEVEMKVLVKASFSDTLLNRFLDDISDKWACLGSPANEFLASVTAKDCNFIKTGIYMINILMNEEF